MDRTVKRIIAVLGAALGTGIVGGFVAGMWKHFRPQQSQAPEQQAADEEMLPLCEKIVTELQSVVEHIEDVCNLATRVEACTLFEFVNTDNMGRSREFTYILRQFEKCVLHVTPLRSAIMLRRAVGLLREEVKRFEASKAVEREELLLRIWHLHCAMEQTMEQVDESKLSLAREIDALQCEQLELLYEIARFRYERVESWEKRISQTWGAFGRSGSEDAAAS